MIGVLWVVAISRLIVCGPAHLRRTPAALPSSTLHGATAHRRVYVGSRSRNLIGDDLYDNDPHRSAHSDRPRRPNHSGAAYPGAIDRVAPAARNPDRRRLL